SPFAGVGRTASQTRRTISMVTPTVTPMRIEPHGRSIAKKSTATLSPNMTARPRINATRNLISQLCPLTGRLQVNGVTCAPLPSPHDADPMNRSPPGSARSCVIGHNGVMDINAENTAPSYDEVVARIADDAPGFWLEQAANLIDWVTEPTRAVDDSNAPIYRWYPDGELNVCYNAVDRHVENGRGDQAAIIYDSPVTDTVRTITYTQLQDEVSRFARALSDRGVAKGDRVVIYMPM